MHTLFTVLFVLCYLYDLIPSMTKHAQFFSGFYFLCGEQTSFSVIWLLLNWMKEPYIYSYTNFLPPYSFMHGPTPLEHMLNMLNSSVCVHVCTYKGWAIKLALALRPLMIYCASPLAAAMIITVAALRIVLAHGSKPT
jgi:hypothetical protein